MHFVWAWLSGLVINGMTLQMNFVNDLVAFLLTYFVMGYLRRNDYRRWIFPTGKKWMAGIYMTGFLFTFFYAWYVKMPGVMANDDAANLVVKHLIGKYAPLQFVMGLAVFFFFRALRLRQSPLINRMAKSVFFVFLLHETVMGVYWIFGQDQWAVSLLFGGRILGLAGRLCGNLFCL